MSDLTIRPAVAADAETIAGLANQPNLHEGFGDQVFSKAQVLRDGFGEAPAFSVLLAESARQALGYALFHDFYNTDLPGRGLWLADIFVIDQARRQGVGRKLFAAVARHAVDGGARCIWWGVLSRNRKARAFYAGLGAWDEDARILELDGTALKTFGEEA